MPRHPALLLARGAGAGAAAAAGSARRTAASSGRRVLAAAVVAAHARRLAPWSSSPSLAASAPSPSLLLALLATGLVLLAGLVSGLTLALMSMDAVELEVLRRSGSKKERRRAARIAPLCRDEHALLVSLLLTNAAAMEALPLVLDRLMDPAFAIALSVTAVLVFGEVLPQAVCSRHGLAIGAASAPLVRALLLVTAPVAWPIARVLDFVLGKHDQEAATFRRKQLKALVGLHAVDGPLGLGDLSGEEVAVICGALDLTAKTARSAMTPLPRVFAVPAEATLTPTQVRAILASGHSRVPVYAAGDPRHIVGLILVKELLQYRLGAASAASRPPVPVTALRLRSLPHLPASTPMYDLLKLFETGRSHMVVLTDTRRSAAEAAERAAAAEAAEAAAEEDEEEDEGEEEHANGESSSSGAQSLASRLLGSLSRKKRRRKGGDDLERPLLLLEDGEAEEEHHQPPPRKGNNESRADWRRRVKQEQSAKKQAELELRQQLERQRSFGGGALASVAEGGSSGGGSGAQPMASAAIPIATTNGTASARAGASASAAAATPAGGFSARLEPLYPSADTPEGGTSPAEGGGGFPEREQQQNGAESPAPNDLFHVPLPPAPVPAPPSAADTSAFAAAAAAAAAAASAAAAAAMAPPSLGDPDDNDSDEPPVPVGIITIEDVIEELLQHEVVDETDKFLDAAVGGGGGGAGGGILVDRSALAAELPVNLRRALVLAAAGASGRAAAAASGGV